MCGKKNPLWETELELFTRSVPFWQGRTVVRGSFPETFLEVSVTYDNRSSSGKAAYFVVKHVALPREKLQYCNEVYFSILSWKFLNFG